MKLYKINHRFWVTPHGPPQVVALGSSLRAPLFGEQHETGRGGAEWCWMVVQCEPKHDCKKKCWLETPNLFVSKWFLSCFPKKKNTLHSPPFDAVPPWPCRPRPTWPRTSLRSPPDGNWERGQRVIISRLYPPVDPVVMGYNPQKSAAPRQIVTWYPSRIISPGDFPKIRS